MSQNFVDICGIINNEFEFSHSNAGKKFFKSYVRVMRDSDIQDLIPIIIIEDLLPIGKVKDKFVELRGYVNTYKKNKNDNSYYKEMYVYPYRINICDDERDLSMKLNKNKVVLVGTIIKRDHRFTSYDRNITDILIRISRRNSNNKFYIIPCVALGKDAVYANGLIFGDKVQIKGFFHVQKYFKSLSSDSKNGEFVDKCEILVSMIKKEE